MDVAARVYKFFQFDMYGILKLQNHTRQKSKYRSMLYRTLERFLISYQILSFFEKNIYTRVAASIKKIDIIYLNTKITYKVFLSALIMHS